MDAIYFEPNASANKKKLQKLQDVMSLVYGVGVGVLGLESFYGFAVFLVGMFLSNALFYVICCQGEPQQFFRSPVKEVFVDGIFSSLSGFIMMWCLTYALVK